MPQHDYVIDNQAGAGFRADVNNVLLAIVANNSGATEPATMYAHMWWADTTANILKRRNAGNTAWISVMSLSLAISTFAETLLDDADASAMLTTLGVSTFAKTILDDASAATARSTLGVGLTSRVKGLRGNVNATTPLTKFDLSADEVVLVDANGATVRRTVTGTLTCDLGLAGSAANGRDQSAAFTASSWINLFFIWNGTTLATIASIASHTTGPTLPSGYTHWAYATSLRWNASSNIIPGLVRGIWFDYDIGSGGVTRLTSGASPTSPTTLSCSGFVPTNTIKVKVNFMLTLTGAINSYTASVRTTGSTANTQIVVRTDIQVAGGASSAASPHEIALNSSQQFDYHMNLAPTTGGLYVEILGYSVPNGDC
jgi:hypothetical protein